MNERFYSSVTHAFCFEYLARGRPAKSTKFVQKENNSPRGITCATVLRSCNFADFGFYIFLFSLYQELIYLVFLQTVPYITFCPSRFPINQTNVFIGNAICAHCFKFLGRPSALVAATRQLCARSSLSPDSEAALLQRRKSFITTDEYSNIGPNNYGFGAPLAGPGLHSLQIYKYIGTYFATYLLYICRGTT
jgi:hypothetical protein